MDQTNICSICQDSLNMYDCILLGRCGHMFCNECWELFKENHIRTEGMNPPKCPSCRSIIHISSIIKKERFAFVRDQLTHNLREENRKLKQELIEVASKNRKEIGLWKHQFNIFLDKSAELSTEEQSRREAIIKEQQEIIKNIHNDWKEFNDYHISIRDAMNKLTQKYTSDSNTEPVNNTPSNATPNPYYGIIYNGMNMGNYAPWYQPLNNLNRSFIIGSALDEIRSFLPPSSSG